MAFKESLIDIVDNVGGGVGAVVMGYDGIAIDEYLPESIQSSQFDMQLLVVEYANLLKEIKRTVDVLQSGEMEEVSVATSNARALVRVINDDFFLFLVIAADGNYGKGRYLLRREAPKLRTALE
jgi:predicted regulator of Ras-like GTPase activity (Roadblock/LC7/MglB family)